MDSDPTEHPPDNLKEQVERIAARLYPLIKKRLGRLQPPPTPEQIDDVIQNTFIKLIKAAPKLGLSLFDMAKMTDWLLTTAYREWVNLLRKKRPSKPLPDDLPDDQSGVTDIGEALAEKEILQAIADRLVHVYALRDLIDALNGEGRFPRKTPPGRPTLRARIGRLLLAIDDLEEYLNRRLLVLPASPPAREPRSAKRGRTTA